MNAGDSAPIGTFDGASATIWRDGADRDALVGMGVSSSGFDCGMQPIAKQQLGPWATVVFALGDCQVAVPWFVFGTAPPDMASPGVFFVSPTPIPLEGGAVGTVLQIPTFTMPPWTNSPVEPDRPWFAAAFSGVLDAFSGDIVFAGADGTIEDSRCGTSPCTDAASQAAYATIRQIVAKEVGPGE